MATFFFGKNKIKNKNNIGKKEVLVGKNFAKKILAKQFGKKNFGKNVGKKLEKKFWEKKIVKKNFGQKFFDKTNLGKKSFVQKIF